jgi:hypothetical protein
LEGLNLESNTDAVLAQFTGVQVDFIVAELNERLG